MSERGSGRRGRGRGRGGGGRSMTREEQVSRALSWLLRHGAESEKLALQEGGWANVADVLQTRKIKPLKVSMDELRVIVAENDKQRFSIQPANATSTVPVDTSTVPADDAATQDALNTEAAALILDESDPRNFLIRANQGHSIKVGNEGLLTPITADNLPTMAVHGTTAAAWPLILRSGGLKRMGRNHIHFAQGLPAGFEPLNAHEEKTDGTNQAAAAAPVISGMRKSSDILIYLDVAKLVDAGIKLWMSTNGVVLTEGNEKGMVGVEFFDRVEDRKRRRVVMRQGIVDGPSTT